MIASDKGIFLYDPQQEMCQKLMAMKSSCLYRDDSNFQFLAGTKHGIFAIDRYGNVLGNIFPLRETISSILRDSQGLLWVGTRGDGLYLLSHDNKLLSHIVYTENDRNSITSNDIISLYEDRHGVMWVGTSTGGVNAFSLISQPFQNLTKNSSTKDGLSDNIIRAIYAENDNKIWLGTKEGYLNLWDRATDRCYRYTQKTKNPALISALAPCGEEKLWVGTSLGLMFFDKEKGSFVQFNGGDSLNNTHISNLYIDRDSSLLCATGNGVFRIANGKVQRLYYKTDSTLRRSNIRVIFRDRSGTLWIGSRDRGLIRVIGENDNSQVTEYMHDPKDSRSLSSNDISAICEDSLGRLWIGTWGGGLNRLDDPAEMTFTHYTERNGLSCFVPRTENFIVYTYDDGVQSNEFCVGAYYQTPSDMLMFGGIGGLTYFRPEDIRKEDSPLKLALTGMFIYNREVKVGQKVNGRVILNRSVRETDKIVIPYGVTQFSFGVSSFSFISPQRNRFIYKLEGFDTDWTQSYGQTSISYSNLSPGKYTLVVNGSTPRGKWQPDPLKIEIVVEPPLWATSYAYILYAVLFSGGACFFIRRYQRHLQNKRMIFQEKLREESQQEIYNAKMQFYINISHELRTPLMLVTGLTDKIMDVLRGENGPVNKYIRVLKRNADVLMHLINELLDLRRIETGNVSVENQVQDIVQFTQTICTYFEQFCESRNIVMNFHSDVDMLNMEFDPGKTGRIIYNLLSNATKFTRDNISVTLSVEYGTGQSWVVISVSDNGEGISEADQARIFERFYQCESNRQQHTGSGIGLNLAAELARLQHGTLGVESTPRSGSTFILRLPIAERGGLNEEESLEEHNDKPQILVVDDNEDVRYYLEEVLGTDYDVRLAASGEQGLEMALRLIPDLIVCDVMMPGISGIEMCSRLKKNHDTNNIPIILVSARSSDETRVEGLACGADAYLVKPFSEAYLKAQVAVILNNRAAIREKLRVELLASPKSMIIKSDNDKLLEKVVSCIEANISNSEYDVEQLCRDLSVSRMQLYRKLKLMIGQSPSDFIRDYRLLRAADLLKQGKLTVSEVAFMVGFNNPKYFRQAFKRKYGRLPSEYLHEQDESSDEGTKS